MNGPVEYPELPPESRSWGDRLIPSRRRAFEEAKREREWASWREMQHEHLIEPDIAPSERSNGASSLYANRYFPLFIAPNGPATYGSWVKYHFIRWFGMSTRGSFIRLLLLMLAVADFIVIVFLRDVQIVRVANDGSATSESVMVPLVIVNVCLLVFGPTLIFSMARRSSQELHGSLDAADERQLEILRMVEQAIERGGDEGRVSIRAHSKALRVHPASVYRRVRLEAMALALSLMVVFVIEIRVVTGALPRLILIVVNFQIYRVFRRFLFRRVETLTGGVPLLAPRAHHHEHLDVDGGSVGGGAHGEPEGPPER